MKSQDSIKAWFKILEEKGEYSHFSGIEVLPSGEIKEYDFFHGDIDGIGGFLSIMKERGESDLVMPALPPRKDPPSFVYAYNFFLYLLRIPFYSPGWKISDKWRMVSEKPSARAWKHLSVEETNRLIANAKKHGVGRNTWLLYNLDLAVKPYLNKSIFPRWWLIPVNLRADFNNHEGNISGFIDARITDRTSPKSLHDKLKKVLLRGGAYGGYVGITLGRFTGHALLKMLVHLNDILQIRTGVFTNLGNWTTKPGVEMKSHWFGFPPVIKTQPFGAMTGSMNGEQSLTVIFHPKLTRDPKIAQECLDRWVELLLQ